MYTRDCLRARLLRQAGVLNPQSPRQASTPSPVSGIARASRSNAKTEWLLPLSPRLITLPDRLRKIRQYRLHRKTPLIYIERIATSTPRRHRKPRHDRVCGTLWVSLPPLRRRRPRRAETMALQFLSRPLQIRCRGLFPIRRVNSMDAKARNIAKNLYKSYFI